MDVIAVALLLVLFGGLAVMAVLAWQGRRKP